MLLQRRDLLVRCTGYVNASIARNKGAHSNLAYRRPGDFFLRFLDYVEDHKSIEWIGCTNEVSQPSSPYHFRHHVVLLHLRVIAYRLLHTRLVLILLLVWLPQLNASYAADGYARLKQNLGVLVTTFGVGELSACIRTPAQDSHLCTRGHVAHFLILHSMFWCDIGATNGIAGAFSEWVPVLHIVGVPSTGLQSKGAMLHHTLGDGRFDAFQNIYSNITVTQSHIKPPHKKSGTSDAGEEIDRAIFEALKNNKPTYLTLPTDLVDSEHQIIYRNNTL